MTGKAEDGCFILSNIQSNTILFFFNHSNSFSKSEGSTSKLSFIHLTVIVEFDCVVYSLMMFFAEATIAPAIILCHLQKLRS